MTLVWSTGWRPKRCRHTMVTSTEEGPVTDIKKGARLTGDDRTRMAERVTAQYNEGRSIREIAQDTGRSYGFVHRVLSESEVALRGRGGPTRRKRE
jgi:hypothetical protein